jgi:hypothetical protein
LAILTFFQLRPSSTASSEIQPSTIDTLKTDFYRVLGPTLRTYFNFQFYTDWDEFALSVHLLEVRHSYWFRENSELVEEVESGLNDFKDLFELGRDIPQEWHENSSSYKQRSMGGRW